MISVILSVALVIFVGFAFVDRIPDDGMRRWAGCGLCVMAVLWLLYVYSVVKELL